MRARKPPLDNAAIDLDGNFMLPVFRVEMRRRMVTVVHPDNDAEEATNFWHDPFYRLAEPMSSALPKSYSSGTRRLRHRPVQRVWNCTHYGAAVDLRFLTRAAGGGSCS